MGAQPLIPPWLKTAPSPALASFVCLKFNSWAGLFRFARSWRRGWGEGLVSILSIQFSKIQGQSDLVNQVQAISIQRNLLRHLIFNIHYPTFVVLMQDLAYCAPLWVARRVPIGKAAVLLRLASSNRGALCAPPRLGYTFFEIPFSTFQG